MARSTRASPELEIKVQPRNSTTTPPLGSPAVTTPSPHQRRPPPPPPPLALHYEPFRKWLPWLVPTIVIVNIGLFVISMYINNCPSHSDKCIEPKILKRFAFESIRENPLLGPSASTLLKMGALELKKVVEEREEWRIATCMWLHAGVFHIFANMLSLVFVGIRLEEEFGFLRIGLLYVISGIGGSLLSSLFVRTTISVGASGALFGLLGGMLSELLTNWSIYANKLSALSTLILIIFINMAVGILPHVDNYAHIGGFVTGFFLGFVLLIRPQFKWVNQRSVPPGYSAPAAKSKYKVYQYVLLVISAVALAIGFTAGLIFLFRGVDGNDYCSWCHYLSCVPTPLWSCDTRCRSMQLDNQLNLTCLHNGKTKSFTLSSPNNTANIQQWCLQLCSS